MKADVLACQGELELEFQSRCPEAVHLEVIGEWNRRIALLNRVRLSHLPHA